MGKTIAVVCSLLLIAALLSTVVGCDLFGDNSKENGQTNGGNDNTIEGIKEKATNAAREANLRIIDAAIQAYYAANGEYPTSISQLSEYFSGGKMPSDPAGGTYYMTTENGVPKAAVK